MPVGLQVICPRLQEESALALATIIEQALRAKAGESDSPGSLRSDK